MKPGLIHEVVRAQSKSLIRTCAVIVLLCLGVLALNWKYVFNWITGPAPFSAALAGNPGAREFVSVKGEFVPTGVAQQSVLKLKGLSVSRFQSAAYMVVQADGKWLVVKVPPKFSSNLVEGRLVRMPEDLAAALKDTPDVYPWLVDAETGYRWDFNLFVLAAVIVLPFASLLLAVFLWRAADISREPAIRELRRFGAPLQVLEQIEADLAHAGDAARTGPFILTASWMVVLDPILKIRAAKEIVAIAKETKVKKSGNQSIAKHFVYVWSRGNSLPDEVELNESLVERCLESMSRLFAAVTIDNVEEFGRKWRADPAACEQELGRRKRADTSMA